MTKMTKSLLGLGVGGIVIGLALVTAAVNVQAPAWAYVALPAGSIFFGLFLISKLLEKESAAYDVEQQSILAAAPETASSKSVGDQRPACCAPATKAAAPA